MVVEVQERPNKITTNQITMQILPFLPHSRIQIY
jgi:hypothetical protein